VWRFEWEGQLHIDSVKYFCWLIETWNVIYYYLFILTANGVLPGDSATTIRHNTQITHITQNKTTIKRNTAHKSTHTIHTLHKMNVMWEPRPLATLGASTACNRDIFTFSSYSHNTSVVSKNPRPLSFVGFPKVSYFTVSSCSLLPNWPSFIAYSAH
jgi:hypothetical protein